MNISLIGHVALLICSLGIIWFFGGLLVDAVSNLAHRFHQNGFTVAFFILGLLTSISELSVMINATIRGTPQISTGNLVGASFVIFLLIIPFLAISGNGITLKNTLYRHQFIASLCVIALPVLLLLDGRVTPIEGIASIISYLTLLYLIERKSPTASEVIESVTEELTSKKNSAWFDIGKIIIGAVIIFLAGNILVKESTYIAGLLSVPSSLIGLILLSVGTNIPEIVIAVRAVGKGKTDVAFGNYIGSAVANTLIFGVLAVMHKTFSVEPSEFIVTAVLMVVGFILFYIFSQSKNNLSRKEGLILISLYAIFIAIQMKTLVHFIAN